MISTFLENYFKSLQALAADEECDLYVVGGTIRDHLLKRACSDFDFVSQNAPELARNFAKQHNLTLVPLDDTPGRETFRVVIEKNCYFDFSQMQGKSLEEDIRRRDFSINAMALPFSDYLKGNTNLTDPCGGQKDLQNKIIRVLPGPIFEDDPLRMLRAFRFAATLGFQIDQKTLDEIKTHKSKISKVAGERIYYELLLILGSKNSDISLMEETGLLDELIPERKGLSSDDKNINLLDTLSNPETLFGSSASEIKKYLSDEKQTALLKLSLLLAPLDKGPFPNDLGPGKIRPDSLPVEVMKKLKASNDDISFVDRTILFQKLALESDLNFAGKNPDETKIYDFIKQSGTELVSSLILSTATLPNSGKNVSEFSERVRRVFNFYFKQYLPAKKKPSLLNGDDLMEKFQLTPSPLFKIILEDIERARVLGTIKTRAEAEAMARNLIETSHIKEA